MRCHKCGQRNKPDSRYCCRCGGALHETKGRNSAQKKRNTLLFLIGVCMAVIFLLLLGIFFTLNRDEKQEIEWKKQNAEKMTEGSHDSTEFNRIPAQETSAPLKVSDQLSDYWMLYNQVINGPQESSITFEEDGTVYLTRGYVSMEPVDDYEGTWSILSQEDGANWSAVVEIRVTERTGPWAEDDAKRLHSTVEIHGNGKELKLDHMSGDTLPLEYGKWYGRELDYFEWSGEEELPSFCPDFMTDISVEEQVLDIREKYYEVRGKLDDGELQKVRVRPGVCVYQDGTGNTRMVIVDKGTAGIGDLSESYSREYYYSADGEMFFALYVGDDSHRLYFYEGRMIRWRYCPEGARLDDATNIDMLYLSGGYLKMECLAVEEGIDLY